MAAVGQKEVLLAPLIIPPLQKRLTIPRFWSALSGAPGSMQGILVVASVIWLKETYVVCNSWLDSWR